MAQRRFHQSLSGRLVLLFVVAGLLLSLLVGASLRWGFRSQFAANVVPHLHNYLDYLRQDVGTPPDLARAEALSRRLPLTIHIIGPNGEAWSSDGEPLDLSRLELRRGREHDGKRYAHGEVDGRNYLVLQDGPYTFAFSVPRERNPWRFAVPVAVLLLMLLLLYHATRRLFAPIAAIKSGVARIGRGELDTPIDVRRQDELGELAVSINAMAGDVRQMLDSKRQLLLAISHELRSPLTRARVAVNLVDDEAQRSDIERELGELETLIDELLETERLASRHQALNRQPVDLNALLTEVVERHRGTTTAELELPATTVQADLDPVRIRLLARNLIDNALRHTPANSPAPTVHLETTDDRIVIAVRDHGPGIAQEHLPHITEPFYRVDPARRRETGGYGLGLYLCRRIAEAHGGRLEVTSAARHGTTVRVTLPVAAGQERR